MEHELSGYRILVVEDEFFLAMDIEDALDRAGAEVIGPLGKADEALQQVRKDGFDLAVVDINLGGDLAYGVADALASTGIPFIFASAYTAKEVPVRHRHRMLIEKPYAIETLVKALVNLTSRS